MPNVTARLKHQWDVLVGDDVTAVQPSQIQTMMRSTERGCITNMGNQVQVWKRVLEKLRIHVPLVPQQQQLQLHQGGGDTAAEAFGWKVSKQPKEKSIYYPSTMAVVIMVSPLCPRTILEQILQVWFHDFGFAHVGLLTSQAFGGGTTMTTTTTPLTTECCTVVDLGWSASHVVPMYQEKILQQGIRRMPLGGRHLVGLWKYYCSYRQWNLMDADLLLDDVHRSLAYVSMEFKEELETARTTYLSKRPFDREYVLPDYQTRHKGFVRLTPWLRKLEREQQELLQQRKEEVDDEADEANINTKHDFIKVEEQEEMENDDTDDDNDQMETREDGDSVQEKLDGDGDVEDNTNNADQDGDDLDEDVDSDEETDDARRKRLLRQKAEEDRRRRDMEAEQQVLLVSVERFTIPEVLFHPSDAQLGNFGGLPATICAAIRACPRMYQSALYGNVRLVGGTSKLPNLKERLERELRALIPTHYPLAIRVADDPIEASWRKAKTWLQATPHREWSLNRSEFESKGAWHRLLNNELGKLV